MSEHDGHRLSVRFGEEILARGHTAIPNLVLNYYVQLGLSGAEMLFTIHVWQHWWSDRDPYPSLRTIAARMGISVRQAKRYVESLETKGLLRVIERFRPDGSQTTNEFDYSPLIRAVVDAARADGALDPAATPPMLRRPRGRSLPGDISVTPAGDSAATPSEDDGDTGDDGSSVTPAMPMPATGALTAATPKEDAFQTDVSHADREPAGRHTTPLTELLDFVTEATGHAPSGEDQRALARLVAEYAPRAAQARPPATGTEWVAAAMMEQLQGGAAPCTPAALRPILDRFGVAAPASAAGPSPEVLWKTTLADLREQVVPANFSRWLERTRLLSCGGGQAVVGVPDQVCAEQVFRRFDPLIRRALGDAGGRPVAVRYQIGA